MSMLPTLITKRTIHRKPEPPPSGRVEQVMLARLIEMLRLYWYQVGVIEECVGDDVLVRFGELMVQVPAEMVVPVDQQ